jgi:ubiquinone/menaquinone biosynthesis C-methylase UbiE
MVRLAGLARRYHARRVLELGAGTGNNTAAFAEWHSCELTALDLSAEMLARARAKSIPAQWVRGAAERIPIRTASQHYIFSVYMLHYVRDYAALFSECRRVLAHGGLAFVTASHGYIERHPMNVYFPSFARIDKARFPEIDTLLLALKGAGFMAPRTETFVDGPRAIDHAYLRRVEGKFISTFSLLPPDEYEAGLERLRRDIAERGRLDAELAWESVVVWADVS